MGTYSNVHLKRQIIKGPQIGDNVINVTEQSHKLTLPIDAYRCLSDGEDNGKNNGVGFVEISKIFATHIAFFLEMASLYGV